MKRILTSILFALAAVSSFADPIDFAKAMQIAQEYIVPGHKMTLRTQAKARRLTTQNSPYYIISRGEGMGFVIVAGDDCLPEVLGYTDSGDFNPDDLPPALQDMLDYWQMAIENAQADGTNITEARARKARRLAPTNRVNIPPFVTSHWHQSSPYNDICPVRVDNGARATSGCVATAASQILYYWRKDLPSTLQSTTPTYNYGNAHPSISFPKGHPVKWDLMLDQYGNEPKEFKQAVAEFVYSVGTATWLTYADGSGTATSGNIEKIPATFSQFFGMNGGSVKYRNSYTQESWTQLIYNELIKGRPVMYTGVHPSNGGHAVFIHGYQASTDKMYFNFGWGAGNGYDGYYTTDQTTGMNGFYDSQSCLVGAYPKKWNVDASIIMPSKLYSDVTNEINVKITNNSTLPLSGFYLYANTSGAKPAASNNPKSENTDVVIPVGGSATITLSAKPTSTRTWYFFVTDENLNVLAQAQTEPIVNQTDLHVTQLKVDASSVTEEHKGITYNVVHNDKTSVITSFHNASHVGFEGNHRMNFYQLNDETDEWTEVGYKAAKLAIGAEEDAQCSFAVSNTSTCPFEVGKYYKGIIETPLHGTTDDITFDNGVVNEVYFVLNESDMEIVGYENGELTIKGHFDNTLFNTANFANKRQYNTATVYDLTQCTDIKNVSQGINPNALIYVPADSKAEGVNVVKDGKCAYLKLEAGRNFAPRADFVAEKAEMVISTVPAMWSLLTVPFNAQVPDGIIARDVTSHNLSGIINKTVDVKTLEAGKSYLVMATSPRKLTIYGENTPVLAQPQQNTDPAFVGTYTTTTTPALAMLVGTDDPQYFVPVEEGSEVPAMSGYFCDPQNKNSFRAYSSTALDPAYLVLAQSIQAAYDILCKYKYMVTTETYESYLSKIQEAEMEFSNRAESTLTGSSKIKTYAAQLLTDGDEYMKSIIGSGNTEIDFTGNIINPSFEDMTTKGWTVGKMEGVTTTGNVRDGKNATNNRAVGLDGKYVFCSLIASADSASVGIEQLVKGLKPGYYRLTAMLGTDDHSTVTLFAGDSTVTVPGHPFGNLYLSKAEINDILVTEDDGDTTGSLLIGVKAGRWYKADAFTLTFTRGIEKEEPDAIEELQVVDSQSTCIYTILGAKVNAATSRGLYIINGKKVFVK